MKITIFSLASVDEIGAVTTLHGNIKEVIEEYNTLRNEHESFRDIPRIEDVEQVEKFGFSFYDNGRSVNITVHEIQVESTLKLSNISE
jgi:hypothetical protein